MPGRHPEPLHASFVRVMIFPPAPDWDWGRMTSQSWRRACSANTFSETFFHAQGPQTRPGRVPPPRWPWRGAAMEAATNIECEFTADKFVSSFRAATMNVPPVSHDHQSCTWSPRHALRRHHAGQRDLAHRWTPVIIDQNANHASEPVNWRPVDYCYGK